MLSDAIITQLREHGLEHFEFSNLRRRHSEEILSHLKEIQTLQITEAVNVVLFLGAPGICKTTVAKAPKVKINKLTFYLVTRAEFIINLLESPRSESNINLPMLPC